MNSETTSLRPTAQHFVHNIPAGILQGDKSLELFACRNTGKVFGVSEGATVAFSDICPSKRAQIYERMINDEPAMRDLRELPCEQALEQFAHCVYGGLDHAADFCEEGTLKESDNFLCSNNCRCIGWSSKTISVNGVPLNKKQISIITLMGSGLADKQVASKIGISITTLDHHKARLFEIFEVSSKPELMVKACEKKIIQ